MTDDLSLLTLPAGWYVYSENDGVDPMKPGLYEWRIADVGSYIGKYGRIRRPTKEYGRNVIRLLNQKTYRRSNPEVYRRIHRELTNAHLEGRRIELIIIENVDAEYINSREKELIKLRGTLNGPIPTI